jgi:hypothetical protein
MIAGAAGQLPGILQLALLVAPAIAKGVEVFIGDKLRNRDFSQPDVWEDVAYAICKTLVQSLINKGSAQLLTLILAAVAEGAAEDAIPLVGQIALGISLAAGAATLLETTTEIAASPVSYVYDLTLAHDITVNILPALLHDLDRGDSLQVTAQFDRGATPYADAPDAAAQDRPPRSRSRTSRSGKRHGDRRLLLGRRLAGGPGSTGRLPTT